MSAVVAVAAVAGLYLAGTRRLAASGARGGERPASPWPLHRTAAFLVGLAVLAAALLTPRADDLLSAHVVEHLLMAMVAAPLLAAGAPAALALRALRGPARRSLADAVRSRPARILTRPAVAWALLAAVTVGVHLPAVYEAALRSPPLHAVEHLLLLGSAVLFWLPLVGVNPVRHRPSALGGVLLLLLAMLPMTAVGVTLTAASEALYSVHVDAARELGASALADQRAAGTIMWVGGSLLLVAAVLAFGMRALLREERREVARERHADAQTSPAEATPILTGGAR